MTESIFAVTSRVLNEPSNSFDVVRIIAKDAKLNKEDRASLYYAADELEAAQRALIICSHQLIETQARLIAVNDRLIEELKNGKRSEAKANANYWVARPSGFIEPAH